jgi:hypothetical protein
LSSDHESSPLVRPYAVTGGRTRPRYELAVEALVTTTPRGTAVTYGMVPEHQAICDMCLEIKSVAEVAALLSMPLGVTRVLVGDMAEAGLVSVQQPGHAEGKPDIALLERVLVGLRNL